MKTFKVAVAGTHSTGKTTFATALKEALEANGFTTAVVSDLGEECRDRGFPILYEHTPQSTLWIMSVGISRELEAALHANVIIVDRPVPDALGYYHAALTYRGETSPDAWNAYLHAVAKHHAATYDLIFNSRLDMSIPMGSSKPRDANGTFRRMADLAVAEVLEGLGLPYEALTPVNGAAAISLVLQQVEARLN